ncbi:MAG: DUF4199 family protein [Sphingobacteriaceae bacterium]|nr:DUF4199 family protein [Cytophagaceae bacterium]
MGKLQFLRPALLFGILAGLLCFGYFLALYYAGAGPLSPRRNLSLVFIWICMALAVRQFSRSVRRPIHFLEGFGICVVVVLLACLLDGLLVVGFIQKIDPELIGRTIAEFKRQVLLDQGRVSEQFGNNRDGLPVDFNDVLRRIGEINLRSIFWSNFTFVRLVLSFMYSALVAVFFRRMSMISNDNP